MVSIEYLICEDDFGVNNPFFENSSVYLRQNDI